MWHSRPRLCLRIRRNHSRGRLCHKSHKSQNNRKVLSRMYKGLDISGQVCLVTGGTSGIGRAIALALAEAGAKVMAGSTNPDKVASIKQELGAGHDAVTLDVSNEASVGDAVAATTKKFGR